MLNKDILRVVLTAESITITEGKLTAIVDRYNQQAELYRLGEATYGNLISLDVWIAVNLPSPEASRIEVQSWIAAIRSRLPLLPEYVPLSTAELQDET